MKFIDNKGNTDPQINLAIEEYIISYLPVEIEPYLLFYINQPSIIIGKHQNTIEEINTQYVEENNIKVVRRLSGGGAVYHDLGNLNFSFITQDDGNSFSNYRKFLKPVIKALKNMGVDAELKGRNDVVVGERKISRNAQFASKGKIITHGTLLFKSNIDEVVNSLNVRKDKIESKGIKSIRSRVANISEFMNESISINEFRENLLLQIFNVNHLDEIKSYPLGENDWNKINQISDERYSNWEWNYGRSPKFYIENRKRFSVGSIDLRLNVEEGIITQIKIYGDFFGIKDVQDIENKLIGVRYTQESVYQALHEVDLTLYFGEVALSDFVKLIY
ncbi:lipoate--protein ligase [Apibacter sp. HY039]|uniref:lipoate--protein ligase n=1 Tax=Apibacter sp. HY039 TaxID=2501476 RepID=UPI000FEB95D3|nr:lipoate--protein ligase [Apibacter sp. HY039]